MYKDCNVISHTLFIKTTDAFFTLKKTPKNNPELKEENLIVLDFPDVSIFQEFFFIFLVFASVLYFLLVTDHAPGSTMIVSDRLRSGFT